VHEILDRRPLDRPIELFRDESLRILDDVDAELAEEARVFRS
jgi:hypothetical protein